MIKHSVTYRYAIAPVVVALVALATLLAVRDAAAKPPLGIPLPAEIELSAADSGRNVSLTEDRLLVIRLEASPSAGYLWEVAGSDEAIIVRKDGNQPEFSSPSDAPGAPVYQVLRFAALSEGQTTLELAYRRPWEQQSPPVSAFSLGVQAIGPFTGANFPTPTPPPAQDLSVEMMGDDAAALGLPTHFSWCEQGKCTPVKDQGQCGSCWAFATVGVMEAAIKIRNGVERDLSEQYLVSCNTDGWGCQGGGWAHSYHGDKVGRSQADAGAVYEADFPYRAQNVSCSSAYAHYEKITSWDRVAGYGVPSVSALKQAIQTHGPVTAGVCVGSAFGGYSGGLFQTDESTKCPYGTNHAVVLTGWDDLQGVWYLRNSWGTGWGENGTMRIKYGVSQVGEDANYVVYDQSPAAPAPAALTVKLFLPAIAR